MKNLLLPYTTLSIFFFIMVVFPTSVSDVSDYMLMAAGDDADLVRAASQIFLHGRPHEDAPGGSFLLQQLLMPGDYEEAMQAPPALVQLPPMGCSQLHGAPLPPSTSAALVAPSQLARKPAGKCARGGTARRPRQAVQPTAASSEYTTLEAAAAATSPSSTGQPSIRPRPPCEQRAAAAPLAFSAPLRERGDRATGNGDGKALDGVAKEHGNGARHHVDQVARSSCRSGGGGASSLDGDRSGCISSPPGEVGASVRRAAASVVAGDACIVVSGEYEGRFGTVAAVDDDGDAFLKLDDGTRAVVPRSLLRAQSPPPPRSQRPVPLADVEAQPAASTPGTSRSTGTDAGAAAEADEGSSIGAACLSALRQWPDGARATASALVAEPGQGSVTMAAELSHFLRAEARGPTTNSSTSSGAIKQTKL